MNLFLVALGLIGFKKEASRVAIDFGFNYYGALYGGFNYIHW